MAHKHRHDESDERQREIECKIRKKRSDMTLKMLSDEYGQNIAKRYRPGVRLDAMLEEAETGSPHQNPEKKP